MKSQRRKTRKEKIEETDPLGVPTEFLCPESGALVGADYNPETRQLRVTLKRHGQPVYVAQEVPAQEWRDFYFAVSKGGHWAGRLKALFEFKPQEFKKDERVAV
jgi:hypothetical protein